MSKSNHTNTNGATRSFKGSGKGQGKIKNEQRFITLSVAVNLAIPEHQAAFLKIQLHHEVRSVVPEYHPSMLRGTPVTFNLYSGETDSKEITELKKRGAAQTNC